MEDNLSNSSNENNSHGHFRRLGFERAASARANLASLDTFLREIISNYEREETPRKEDYQAKSLAAERKVKELNEQKKNLEPQLESIKTKEASEIEKMEGQISQIQKELLESKENPKEIAAFDRAKLGVLIALIAGLSIYLFVFYISAGHSAFFKDIRSEMMGAQSPSEQLQATFNSIFDGRALPESLRTFNVFLLFFPFVFLALGYLIHVSTQKKNWVAAGAFGAVGFFFDGAIAYQITKKFQDIQQLMGLVENVWDITAAIKDIQFWTIILAGFVVYIAWSFLVHSLSEEYEKSQPWKHELATKLAQIKELKEKIEDRKSDTTNQVSAISQNIVDLDKQLQENGREVDRYNHLAKSRVIRWSELEKRFEAVTGGWIDYVAGTIEPSELEEKAAQIRKKSDERQQEELQRLKADGVEIYE